jgi:hypothetical protein
LARCDVTATNRTPQAEEDRDQEAARTRDDGIGPPDHDDPDAPGLSALDESGDDLVEPNEPA